jgi:hypothetical protein
MWFRSTFTATRPRFSTGRSRQSQKAERRRRARRLLLEPLEARLAMAFSPFSEYAAGSSTAVQVVGDFTGDGAADLVVSNSGGLQLMRGNGDGSFQSPASLSSVFAKSVAAGDLIADGKLDLITNDNIFLGNGNGTFQAPIAISLPPRIPAGYHSPVAQQSTSVAVGDLNNDGKLDVTVTGRSTISVFIGSGYYGNYYNTYTSGQVNVLLGNGDGTLASALVTDFPQQSVFDEALALVDLNHDSKLDLLVTHSNSNLSSVFLGDGTGAMGAPSPFSSGYGLASILTGDFNEDGHLDLVTRGFENRFVLNKGHGDGTFENPVDIIPEQSGLYSRSVAVGDINADGHLDIAFTTQRLEVTEYGYVSGYYGYYKTPIAGIIHDAAKVILGNGAGGFSAPVTNDLGSRDGLYGGLYTSLLGDFDNDGLIDLVAADRTFGLVTVALNNGSWVPPAAVTIADVSIAEGNSGQTNAVITVMLTGNHDGVTLDYLTADYGATAGSDYVAKAGTLTFAPGVFSQTIVVPIKGDRLGEGNETFFITLSNANGAIFLDNQALVTILDNEPVISIDHNLSVDPLTVVEGNSGTKPAVFTVTLSQAYDQEVTVHYYSLTGNVNDIISVDNTLRFAPGETSKTITVQVVGDLIPESLEAFNVYLDTPSANASLGNAYGYCYIQDNDPFPTVSISDVTKNEGNSGTTKFNFTLTLSAPAADGIYVYYETANGTASSQDYVPISGYAYFNPGQSTATIAVSVKGDKTKEENETFFVNLTNASGATLSDAQAIGTIINDDGTVPPPPPPTPQITIGDSSIAEGNSGTKLLAFTVSLSQSSSKEVTVNYATANNSAKTSDNDYQSKSGTIRFAPGETAKTISITVNGDKKFESNETFKVNLSSAANGQISDSQGLGTILNDDVRSTGKNRSLSPSAFDSVLADWESSSPKKRTR